MTQEFKFPGMPSAPTKKQIADAVVLFNIKYRTHYHILPHEQLLPSQVEQIVDGVRDLLYQYEELKKGQTDDDFNKDDDGETFV